MRRRARRRGGGAARRRGADAVRQHGAARCTHAVRRSDDSFRMTFTPPRMALPTLQYELPKSRPTTAMFAMGAEEQERAHVECEFALLAFQSEGF